MSEQALSVSKQFGKLLLVIAGMNLQIYLAARDAQKLRKTLFNQQYMNQHFGPTHKSQIQQSIQAKGHPDNGAGLYSQRLSYRDWYRFNVLQRIHLNYLQNINLATTATLAAGLYDTRVGIGVGTSYIIGRVLYSFFYKQQHGARNKGRVAGIIICHLATMTGIGFFLKKWFE